LSVIDEAYINGGLFFQKKEKGTIAKRTVATKLLNE